MSRCKIKVNKKEEKMQWSNGNDVTNVQLDISYLPDLFN